MSESSWSRRVVRSSVRLGIRAAIWIGIAIAVLIVGFSVRARLALPELQPWHRLTLDAEFRAGSATAPKDFTEYLALEDRLFTELRQKLLSLPSSHAQGPGSRFNESSVPGQLAQSIDNRSHERVPEVVKGSILLVHGLSDSPYSMHAIEELCFAKGLRVLSLRLPGHGTIPAGLLNVTWEDWYAAVELAARHLAKQEPGKPLYACGYSTGAPLLALLSVRSLHDASLPRPQRLVLVSAAIGVSEYAAIANLVSALSFVPYFERASWLDVLPEYDPFKYNSFTVNAGYQIHRLTKQLQTERAAVSATPEWTSMPKVLAFQSIVDATVSAPDVVRQFFIHLRGEGHELVAFDVNRNELWCALLAPGPIEEMEAIRTSGPLPFRLTVVASTAPRSNAISLYSRAAGSVEVTKEDLELSWPQGVFALGHVALPFPVDDPVYGLSPRTGTGPQWQLGRAVRGEGGAIQVSLGALARLRCNPFFDVIRKKLTTVLEGDLGR